MHNPAASADLVQIPLLDEEMYLVSPPDTPARDGVGIAELAELPLVLPSAPNSLRQLVAAALGMEGRGLRPAMEVEGLAIIKALVGHGLGHTVLTYSAVAEEVARGTLRATRLVRPGISWSLCIAMRKELRQNQAATALARTMREEVEKLVSAGQWRGKTH